MAAFRLRSFQVDAFQWTGGPDQLEDPVWICEAIREGNVTFVRAGPEQVWMYLHSLTSIRIAKPGDWIVRDADGRLSAYRPDVFAGLYEEAPE
jgi:hypothetical protein